MADHCVKIYIPLSDKQSGTVDERERIFDLEDQISDAVDAQHLVRSLISSIGLTARKPNTHRLWCDRTISEKLGSRG
ncbi:hypothetical protein K9N68_36895 (plasmid) [Kovacikia minuta CCNUW1]|uniref:hypothetical protein n=1 Tax=Kovacikia minuta TaxID=2931930 RepID=UPI001CCD1DD4|nr:hypothetical protein [Kovacikia minuta]UBF29806.1 hypothetical protein K9N68_36895 [Kovacikia minuta CCNUW1]